ncbi:MAG: DJ-1/PfpI family protein [Candidatus Cloacimonetes bacterium]|nr:DJ-1/PfpI family protein [Candidatus Cloacimonadota bacterium]
MKMKKILIPLPSYGFDPTEVAIPWKLISEQGMKIVFITPEGKKASADIRMLMGKNLGIWKSVLRAGQDAVDAYHKMEKTDSFCNPHKYIDVYVEDFDAILLPGGHDKGVKEYLESEVLQQHVVDFFVAQKPVGAICHGVVLAARSINPDTQKSVIHNYKTTSLLKSQELLAYNLTRLWLKDYYLTYPEVTVEDEVKSVLSDSNNFLKGPTPFLRDSYNHLKRGFVVRDRNYLSARWPGDAYNFSLEFIKMVQDVKN